MLARGTQIYSNARETSDEISVDLSILDGTLISPVWRVQLYFYPPFHTPITSSALFEIISNC